MKKLTLFICTLWVTCSVWAQQSPNRLIDAELKNQQQIINSYSKIPLTNVKGQLLNNGSISGKTTEDEPPRDTIYYTSYWDDPNTSEECRTGIYFVSGGELGYINGTLAPLTLTTANGDSFQVVITHHANAFSIPRRANFPKAWLETMIVGVTDQCTKIGDADTFRLQVFPISDLLRDQQGVLFGARSGSNPVVEQPWTLDRFPNGNTKNLDRYFIQYPITTYDEYPPSASLRGGYMFSFETVRAYGNNRISDDTLALLFSAPSGKCDPNNSYDDWYISIVDVDTPQIGLWRTLRTLFYPANQQNDAIDQPAIFPVVYFEGVVGVDEVIYESKSLKYYGNYPNPAPEFTNMVFEYNRNATVQIILTDLAGRMVYDSGVNEYAAGKHQHTINTSNLPCGTYTYLIKSNQGSMGGRIMVDR